MSDFEIIGRILQYCEEIQNTHDYFGNNRELFFNSKTGFVYRNAITMLLLQIGELSKLLTLRGTLRPGDGNAIRPGRVDDLLHELNFFPCLATPFCG